MKPPVTIFFSLIIPAISAYSFTTISLTKTHSDTLKDLTGKYTVEVFHLSDPAFESSYPLDFKVAIIPIGSMDKEAIQWKFSLN